MLPETDSAQTDVEVTWGDYLALSPTQQRQVTQRVIREAHVARAKEVRAALGAVWRGAARAVGVAADGVVTAWHWYHERRERRITAARLYAMDDRMLHDIGLRRGEIDFLVAGKEDPTRRPRAAAKPRAGAPTIRCSGPERKAA
jgi:uncharacterized protein YjiS (DUF1127 family)